MLPTRLAILTQLPRTAAGKVDTRALPEPEAGDPAAAASDTTDWSPTERTLAQEVIGPLTGADVPGRADGFFELGGNSIQAAQVTARVRDRFGVEISLVDFFREPTVAGLARLVDQARGGHAAQAHSGTAAPAETAEYRMSAGATVPLSFQQASLYASCQAHGDLLGYHAPMALRLRGPLDTEALRRAFGLLATRHAPLRATIADGPVQHIHPAAEPPFEIADVPGRPPSDRELLLRRALSAFAAEPFDLAASPPLRVRVHRMAGDDHVLQWVIHHVATDGWSIGVQLHELGTAYTAFAAGREPVLTPLRTDYGDFVFWQRRYVAGPEFRDDIAWWRDHLAGLPAGIRLPQAQAEPFQHGWRNLTLPDQTATAVRAFARTQGVTLFMVTLTAYAILVSAETCSDEVLTVTPTALRMRSAWEDLVGWFANPVPVRVRLASQQTFADLAAQVRTSAVAALAHRNVPFELLRRELGLGSEAIATQVSVMNAPARAFTFASLDIAIPADDSGRGFTPVLEVYSPPDRRYQLSVVLRERMGGVIAGGLEYDAGAFPDPATADRWHAAFLSILAAGTANPATSVAELRGHAS
jgi:acyl carrier protein